MDIQDEPDVTVSHWSRNEVGEAGGLRYSFAGHGPVQSSSAMFIHANCHCYPEVGTLKA